MGRLELVDFMHADCFRIKDRLNRIAGIKDINEEIPYSNVSIKSTQFSLGIQTLESFKKKYGAIIDDLGKIFSQELAKRGRCLVKDVKFKYSFDPICAIRGEKAYFVINFYDEKK